jgi:hypothetical protein
VAKDETKRLPLHRALFYFAPRYLETPSEWRTHFAGLIEELLSLRKLQWSFYDALGDWTLTVRFPETQFSMCARTGTFMFEEPSKLADDDFSENLRVGPLTAPPKFYDELAMHPPPSRLAEEVKRVSFFCARPYLADGI